ncbi:MAG: K(+)-transporting ATPase subunit F [Proteobacteria bacterium]|nr:K(+)-transporting ATPase subunit F [Pseudomonadota bacterium]
MNLLYAIGGVLAVLLAAYLLVALFRAEEF